MRTFQIAKDGRTVEQLADGQVVDRLTLDTELMAQAVWQACTLDRAADLDLFRPDHDTEEVTPLAVTVGSC